MSFTDQSYCTELQIKLEGEPNPDISDVAVLSLGTGSTLPKTKNLERAGAFQWLASGALINTMMDGTSRYLQALIDDVYHRLKKESTILGQYVRIDNIDEYSQEYAEVLSVMDDPGNVDALREIGEELGRECYGVIKEYIELCLVKEDNWTNEILQVMRRFVSCDIFYKLIGFRFIVAQETLLV